MLLSKLELLTFRNFSKRSLVLPKRVAITGRNGVGKSNILEAIRLLSVGKSFKTNRLDEVIQFDQLYFRLLAQVNNKDEQALELFYGQQFADSVKEKRLSVNNKPVNALDYFGQFTSVLFLPSDIDLVLGSPQLRRRYLDGIFWQLSKQFRQDYLQLNKVLKERSALLHLLRHNQARPEELQPWTTLLVELTTTIQEQRQRYGLYLNEAVKRKSQVFEGRIELGVRYRPNSAQAPDVYTQEVRLGQNLIGPHRDELDLLFNDRPARQFASRGQARMLVVLLKLIERDYLKENTDSMPVILFDDLVSELDQQNYHQLLDFFDDSDQIIATSVVKDPLLTSWQEIAL